MESGHKTGDHQSMEKRSDPPHCPITNNPACTNAKIRGPKRCCLAGRKSLAHAIGERPIKALATRTVERHWSAKNTPEIIEVVAQEVSCDLCTVNEHSKLASRTCDELLARSARVARNQTINYLRDFNGVPRKDERPASFQPGIDKGTEIPLPRPRKPNPRAAIPFEPDGAHAAHHQSPSSQSEPPTSTGELRLVLNEALSKLRTPREIADAFLERSIDGIAVNKLASELDMRPNTLSVKFTRICQALRRLLPDSYCLLPPDDANTKRRPGRPPKKRTRPP